MIPVHSIHGNSSWSSSESSSEEHPPDEQGDTGDKRINAICNSFEKAGSDLSADDENREGHAKKKPKKQRSKNMGPMKSMKRRKVAKNDQ